MWQIIIANLIGKNTYRLRVNQTAYKPYDRDLLFILVSDYLTQMMEMDRKLQETFRPSEAKEIVVQKMFKRYGEELVMLWSKEVKYCSEFNKMGILYQVQENTNRWKRDDIDTPIQLITTLAWERYKSEIIKNIIEPHIRNQHHNYKKRCLSTEEVEGTTIEKEATESSAVIPSEVSNKYNNNYKKRCLSTEEVEGTTIEKEATESSAVIPSEVSNKYKCYKCGTNAVSLLSKTTVIGEDDDDDCRVIESITEENNQKDKVKHFISNYIPTTY